MKNRTNKLCKRIGVPQWVGWLVIATGALLPLVLLLVYFASGTSLERQYVGMKMEDIEKKLGKPDDMTYDFGGNILWLRYKAKRLNILDKPDMEVVFESLQPQDPRPPRRGSSSGFEPIGSGYDRISNAMPVLISTKRCTAVRLVRLDKPIERPNPAADAEADRIAGMRGRR